jgi:CheY-like chemotaxis protein
LRSLASGGKKRERSLPRHAAMSVHDKAVIAMVLPPDDPGGQVTHPPTREQEELAPRRAPGAKSRLRYALDVSTVLIASDLASLRRELRNTLEGPGLDVEEAATGPEVLERVREGGVDLVMVDLQMGSMGAMAVCLDLRAEESYGGAEPVSVLMLLDRRPDVFLARRSGAEGFLVKPLDPQRVRAAVRALLRGESYEDESWRPATVRAGER